MTPSETETLVERARAGDRDAFNHLVEHYQDRLAAAVRMRMGAHLRQRVDVEDVLQETFLKGFTSLNSFEERRPDAFFHWLKGIADNLLLYWARQLTQREQLQLNGDVKRSTVSPSRKLRRQERFERLEEALGRLSPEHREVVLLARVEGLPAKEIARRMNKSDQAIKPLLWRALQKLRGAFGDTQSMHLPRRAISDLPSNRRKDDDAR